MPSANLTFAEVVMYGIAILMVIVINRYFRSYLKYFEHWPLNLAIILLPTCLVLIYNLGWIIYGLNILPVIILLTAFVLGLQLYYYIRQVEVFYFQAYYLPASELVFMIFSTFLVGLLMLRIWLLFK
ncbi:hypothetical protein HZY91_02115 [Facklamia sp. DSM 111018]|uniref:Uncharacterized protein n=1 Tax=Facklamia lactis TaxID=2749967 RepID=A0ABS0LNE7_9LACT|nr:hypothetical protein [Facklamia lactis]MBG9979635.1 hypothetical protein [Facklamia lactis]MBG9985685.1 hypothetical protein [Facklamia lactis]